jgi:hypothetical protein
MAARHRKIFIPRESDDARHEPPKTCPTSGKRMYPSEAEAKATAAHRMSEQATAQLRTYRCLYCGAWHLTSKQG